MGMGLIIWSKKPVHQKETLLGMVEAAYDGCLQFQLQGYRKYVANDSTLYNPGQFVLQNDNPNHTPMIFHICNLEEQQNGICKWEDTKFINIKNKTIIEPLLYRLAVSEDLDNEMTFYFSYHYLKKHKKQLLSMSDYLIDWSMISKAFKEGYTENWYNLQ